MGMLGYDEVELLEQAAESGVPEAQARIGLLYSTGRGLPLDYVSAHKWLNLAARAGDAAAKDLRREVAAAMSAPEIAEAQRAAREWLVTH